MPLNLRDVQGSNYFSIYPAEIDKNLASIAARAAAVQEDGLEGLKLELGACIGYRAAQQVTTPKGVVEAAQEERLRLQREKAFMGAFFGKALRAAGREANASGFNPNGEIRRDAVYHTIVRSGFPAFSFVHGSYADQEAVADNIHSGRRRLDSYLPSRLQTDTEFSDMLILALVSSRKRQDLLNHLREEFQISKEAAEEIERSFPPLRADADKALERLADSDRDDLCRTLMDRRNFRGKWSKFLKTHALSQTAGAYLDEDIRKSSRALGNSQPFRLAAALKRLLQGRSDISWVLPLSYSRPKLYNLAYLLERDVDLRRLDERRFHTPIATTSAEIGNWATGEMALQQDVLAYLSDLTGEDAFSHVTRWGLGSAFEDIIHPQSSIDDVTLGAIYGSFLARASESDGRWSFILHSLPPEEFMDAVEGVGRLPMKIKPSDKPHTSALLGKSYRSTKVAVPKQLGNLFATLQQDVEDRMETYLENETFRRAMLRHYVKNKGHPVTIKQWPNYRGYSVAFSDVYVEDIVRRFATREGLSISGETGKTAGRVYSIKNPQVVGLMSA